MPKNLFSGNSEPACSYCVNGRASNNNGKVLCPHKGIVDPSFHCAQYQYNPLKRVPRRAPALPKFDSDEFSL